MTTSKKYRISKEVKDQVLKRIKDEGVSVSNAAEEHGISTHTIYRWLTGGVSANPSWSEVAKLKKENKALLELLGEVTMKLSVSQKNN